jgi:hypothetical protein
MVSLAIFGIMLLWILSIFSFAKWRYAVIDTPERRINISNDLAFQIYLKLSGFCFLGWIGIMLAPN